MPEYLGLKSQGIGYTWQETIKAWLNILQNEYLLCTMSEETIWWILVKGKVIKKFHNKEVISDWQRNG